MRFFEIKPNKPPTPQQQRIKSLQTQKQNIAKQLKAERDRQKKQKLLKQLGDLSKYAG